MKEFITLVKTMEWRWGEGTAIEGLEMGKDYGESILF